MNRCVLIFVLVSIAAMKFSAADDSSVYGKSTSGESALLGMFYDLKQNQQHVEKDIGYAGYEATIDEFLTKGWDETVLSNFYRASKPVYATQVFIPIIPATEGPKAFGVGNLVQGSFYLINYKGQVEVPQDGTYRFVGYGDNVLIVGVNQKTVLIGDRADITLPHFKWTSTGTGASGYPDASLVNGTWLPLKSGDVIDLDILIGESSGGSSAFFLMIEKQGEHYPDDGKGHPILPIFQVAPYDTPLPAPGIFAPKVSKSSVIWKCLQ